MKENSFITCRLQHVITLRSVDELLTSVWLMQPKSRCGQCSDRDCKLTDMIYKKNTLIQSFKVIHSFLFLKGVGKGKGKFEEL